MQNLLLTCLVAATSLSAFGQCEVGAVTPAFPLPDSTIYIAPGCDDINLIFVAGTDCASDTEMVNFTIDESVSSGSGDSDAEGFFSATLGKVSDVGYGEHTLHMTVTSKSNPETVVALDIDFAIAVMTGNVDADANGLLDDPLEALPEANSYWFFSTASPVTGHTQVTAIGHVAPGAAALAAADPETPWASVVARIPSSLLYGGEEGIFVLRTAPDLLTLYGRVEASIFGVEPGALVDGSQYADISLMTTFPNSDALFKISSQRLAAHPLHVVMNDLYFISEGSPAVYSHATQLQVNPATGLELIAWESDWLADHVCNTRHSATRIEADMVAMSTFAAFETTLDAACIHTLPESGQSYGFGYVKVGETKDATFSVMNYALEGGARLIGEASTNPPFSFVSGYQYDLAPGESTEITVRFTPETNQGYIGNILFSGGGSAAVTLKGVGFSDQVIPPSCNAATMAPHSGFGGFAGDLLVVTLAAAALTAGRKRAGSRVA